MDKASPASERPDKLHELYEYNYGLRFAFGMVNLPGYFYLIYWRTYVAPL